MPIHVLGPELVAKIAAGEVVERPASVVKELVENALDAGATRITVEAWGGGVSLIRVSDNGSGISPEEVELAFQRHATSKISDLADLGAISSLGFRGEALPSIAAVAEVDMVTRTADNPVAARLSLREGVITRRSQARAVGTTVTVRHLFRHLPARLKFLKSTATENSHIATLVADYALAFPEVAFDLMLEGRASLTSPGTGSLRDVCLAVFGLETAQALLEIPQPPTGEVGPPVVSGLVGPPWLSRSSRSSLRLFVNRRWISSPMLARAVEDAYRGMISPEKHPIAIINLSLPPAQVDVNVHPTKSQVRFHEEGKVFRAVYQAVQQTLLEHTPVPQIQRAAPTPVATASVESPPLWAEAQVERKASAKPLPLLRVLGQLSQSYIIAEGPEGLYLIDQHAAHERVLFERLKGQLEQRGAEVQGLLEPVTLEVSPQQEAILRGQGATLRRYGFDIEAFGPKTYLVRAVPAVLPRENLGQAIQELLDGLAQESPASWEERLVVALACHGAVKAGQVLKAEEMEGLVRQLEKTAQPHTCPHGRPTLIHLSSGQLAKEFGRR
ncbi:MAG TPA: DNA mismatch repair endonuclease MutL [Dehalococcoidia bacterium]|nr:DNA mismatch repair endonuclease MutL [Dehalococcoidia bacterium]